MDPITLAVGGAILAAGWLVGRANRRSKTPKLPKPICSCEHGSGTHENSVGHCHAEIKRPVQWRFDRDGFREVSHYEWVPCPCRAYDGPEPLPRAWVPELPGLEDKRDA